MTTRIARATWPENLAQNLDLLTAELLASPARGNSCSGAEFGIDGDGGTETVAVAAEVAGARVVYATLEIRSRVHHLPTSREHRTVHHAAFLGKQWSSSNIQKLLIVKNPPCQKITMIH